MAVGNKKTGTLSTVADYWNAAYRGLLPGGLNQVPPEYSDIGPDPEPIDQPDDPYVLPDPEVAIEENVVPVPVVITADVSHTRKRVEKYVTTMSANVVGPSPRILIPRDPFRTQVIIQAVAAGGLSGGAGVYLGHNESVGTTGFLLPVGQVIVLGTTREVWAIVQSAIPATGTESALVSVLMEYDKDTA